MSERKEQFTPRPWRAFDVGYGFRIEPDVCWIGENSNVTKKQRTANKDLIVSAPEMYFALKDMVLTVTDLLEAICSGEENTDCLIAVVLDEIDNAVKVLKKARCEE